MRVLQWFSQTQFACFGSTKSTIVYVFIVPYWPIIASKSYSISFFRYGILLQQPIALLEGITAHFSNVYCTILKEMRGREIFKFLGRRHNSRSTHSPQTRSWNKMAVFWDYFRDLVGAQKIEDLTESKNFFAEVFQITSRFLLAKKILGLGAL